MDNATGIPSGGNQTLMYFVEVSNSSSAVLFSATVDHPTNMVEAPNLPACENLTVSVTAENLFFNGTTASEDFMTVGPGWFVADVGSKYMCMYVHAYVHILIASVSCIK